jgi:hypothetical protein
VTLWEPLYVLIPKLGTPWEPLGTTLCIDSQAGTLWEPLYVLIPKLVPSGSLWEHLGTTLCIDSQAGTLWEPLGTTLCIDSQAGSLSELLGNFTSFWIVWDPIFSNTKKVSFYMSK